MADSSTFKMRKLWIAAILFTLASGFLFLTCSRTFGSPFNDREFNSTEWRNADPDDPNSKRGSMAEDLRSRYLKVGLSKAQVEGILGKPTQLKPPSDFDIPSTSPEKETWNYVLGCWSGFRVDYDFLAIAFDKNGKLVSTWIWQS